MTTRPTEHHTPQAGAALPEFAELVHGGNVLRELRLAGRNVIRPWGVEFADSSAFFSLEEGVGYRFELLDRRESGGARARELVQVIRMREGLVRLEVQERLEGPRELRRSCTLTCLEPTTLMDFVLRYRFLPEELPHGMIGGSVLKYRGSGEYNQFAVDQAAVGNDGYSLRVEAVDSTVPSCMRAHVYLRDGEEGWVLHLRMLPVTWDLEVVKLCSRWFGTRPLPRWATRPLLGLPGVRGALWYRGERRPWRNAIARVFAANAFPMCRLPAGEVLRWDAICRVEPPFGASRSRSCL